MVLRVDKPPRGLCQCGCGEPTALAKVTDNRRGNVAGEPVRFVLGHQSRKSVVEYVEEERGYDSACWIWQRATNNAGYAQTTLDRLVVYVHRVNYERVYGPIPENYDVDHLCRVPSCVNPAHLEAVTHKENYLRGIRAGKLTWQQVDEIREIGRNAKYPYESLVAKYGVGPSAIHRILRGKSWTE